MKGKIIATRKMDLQYYCMPCRKILKYLHLFNITNINKYLQYGPDWL